MEKSFLLGKFWDPEHTMTALKRFKESNTLVYDVYSPFPIHGIEPYLNIKRTRLTVASFIYGCIGFAVAVSMMSLLFGVVWPMNIGGKPSLALPSFVPITFELTVLFAAHGLVITFFIIGRYWPGKKARLMDDRQTDDVIVLAIDRSKLEDESSAMAVLRDAGAYEITTKEFKDL
jgi:hypothetical protein